jgi:hypothetical protein
MNWFGPETRHLERIFTNPPFGNCRHTPAGVGSSVGELAFMELAMQSLAPGDHGGIVVPDGFLFRDERAFRRMRERLLTEFTVLGIVRLPPGTFTFAPSVRTNLLIFRCGGAPSGTIRYYHAPSPAPQALGSALAWVQEGHRNEYSWEVYVEDLEHGDWNLDIPWPGSDDQHGAAVATATVSLGDFVERRGMPAEAREVDPILGVSKDGFAPFKGKPAPDQRRYRRVQAGDFAYNPMRAHLGSIALCEDSHAAGWVSPDYVVFRLTPDSPFSSRHLLDFLTSPAGMAQAERHSHGSVYHRLRFRDLRQIAIPLPSTACNGSKGASRQQPLFAHQRAYG